MQRKKIYRCDTLIEKTKLYDVPAIEMARQIIETDPSERLSISTLAAKVGINEFKLKLGFRELFKTSPHKYLVRLRLDKAKELLAETDCTVQEIADKTGFESYCGLSVAFKNAFTISPSQFRRQLEVYYTDSVLVYKMQ